MNPVARAPRSYLRSGALAFICASLSLLPFNGCMGGTTSEGGNPGVMQFRRDGQSVRFNGFIKIVATDSNPSFFRRPPEDGGTHPISIVIGGPSGISSFVVPNSFSYTLSWDDIASSLYPHPELPLAKSASVRLAGLPKIPDFNILFIGIDGSAGWITGVHPDPTDGFFHLGGKNAGDPFVVDLDKEYNYTGTVDTASPAGKPRALFVPGTVYFAEVHGDRFRFEGVPAGRLPLRCVTASGLVHAIADSLGVRNGAKNVYEFEMPGSFTPGARLDSIEIPPAYPTLAPPSATPAGQYAFTDSVVITLGSAYGATIYYTLDGSRPDIGSKPYTAPIVLHSSATLKAMANQTGFNHSDIAVNNYVLVPATPTATPPGGVFSDSVRVTLKASAGAVIRYTLDGQDPTSSSAKYTGPLTLKTATTLKASAELAGLGLSRILAENYVVVPDTTASQ